MYEQGIKCIYGAQYTEVNMCTKVYIDAMDQPTIHIIYSTVSV